VPSQLSSDWAMRELEFYHFLDVDQKEGTRVRKIVQWLVLPVDAEQKKQGAKT
jgi:hypothetical protein